MSLEYAFGLKQTGEDDKQKLRSRPSPESYSYNVVSAGADHQNRNEEERKDKPRRDDLFRLQRESGSATASPFEASNDVRDCEVESVASDDMGHESNERAALAAMNAREELSVAVDGFLEWKDTLLETYPLPSNTVISLLTYASCFSRCRDILSTSVRTLSKLVHSFARGLLTDEHISRLKTEVESARLSLQLERMRRVEAVRHRDEAVKVTARLYGEIRYVRWYKLLLKLRQREHTRMSNKRVGMMQKTVANLKHALHQLRRQHSDLQMLQQVTSKVASENQTKVTLLQREATRSSLQYKRLNDQYVTLLSQEESREQMSNKMGAACTDPKVIREGILTESAIVSPSNGASTPKSLPAAHDNVHFPEEGESQIPNVSPGSRERKQRESSKVSGNRNGRKSFSSISKGDRFNGGASEAFEGSEHCENKDIAYSGGKDNSSNWHDVTNSQHECIEDGQDVSAENVERVGAVTNAGEKESVPVSVQSKIVQAAAASSRRREKASSSALNASDNSPDKQLVWPQSEIEAAETSSGKESIISPSDDAKESQSNSIPLDEEIGTTSTDGVTPIMESESPAVTCASGQDSVVPASLLVEIRRKHTAELMKLQRVQTAHVEKLKSTIAIMQEKLVGRAKEIRLLKENAKRQKNVKSRVYRKKTIQSEKPLPWEHNSIDENDANVGLPEFQTQEELRFGASHSVPVSYRPHTTASASRQVREEARYHLAPPGIASYVRNSRIHLPANFMPIGLPVAISHQQNQSKRQQLAKMSKLATPRPQETSGVGKGTYGGRRMNMIDFSSRIIEKSLG